MTNTIIYETNNNILNIIGIKYLGNKNIIILRDPKFFSSVDLGEFKTYLNSDGYTVNEVSIDPYDMDSCYQKLSPIVSKDDVFILPAINYAFSYNFMILADKLGCKAAHVEEDGDVFVKKGMYLTEVKDDNVSLDLDDYIKNFGGKISHKSDNMFDEKTSNLILDMIISRYKTYQNIMKPSPPIETEGFDKSKVRVLTENLKGEELKLTREILNIMKSNGICSIWEKRRSLIVHFHNREYKEYIGKSGTWFEHLTYRSLKSIQGIDTASASVTFLWDKSKDKLKNEIDVMGIHDNRLIVISCKDTHSYSDSMLNEIFVHSSNLGYGDTIKILATTNSPTDAFRDRARDLNISIVTFDGSEQSFTKELSNVIKIS